MSDAFERVTAEQQLPPGQCMEVRVGDTAVALCNVDGSFHAIANTCVHRGGPLGQGDLDGKTLICPWHSWAFDVTTGVSEVNPELRVERFETRVEDGHVLVKAR